MQFNSLLFLCFFPCVLTVYFLVPRHSRNILLLVMSYYFYMCWKPELIVLILLSTLIDYGCSLGIEQYRGNLRIMRIFLGISLVTNLGLLFFFKYFNFFGETLTALCKAISIPFSVPTLDIILPVGISFYTFQTLSYTIDIYRGQLRPERNFITFALFVSFFPQLVAGPIERAGDLLPQLKKYHSFSYADATYGAKLMVWGFFKKCVIADWLSLRIVDPVYQNLASYHGGILVVATVAFAIQIYCDFSGYSDIARGCARMMGIHLMENFRAPYLCTSIRDFWKRWHISLTNWFREYVYIPLGGNRKGLAKTLLFTIITFTLSGLWHGASWTFVVWGLLHALYLCGGILCRSVTHHSIKHPSLCWCRTLWVFGLVCFAWVFFRAATLVDACYVLNYAITGLQTPFSYVKEAIIQSLGLTGNIMGGILLGCVLLLFLYDYFTQKLDVIVCLSKFPIVTRWAIYICFVLMLILLIPKNETAPFIYFQF